MPKIREPGSVKKFCGKVCFLYARREYQRSWQQESERKKKIRAKFQKEHVRIMRRDELANKLKQERIERRARLRAGGDNGDYNYSHGYSRIVEQDVQRNALGETEGTSGLLAQTGTGGSEEAENWEDRIQRTVDGYNREVLLPEEEPGS